MSNAPVFTDEVLSESEQPFIVKFGAAWCGPCNSMNPTIDNLIEEKYPVYEVDVTASQEMTLKYNIRNLPTIILFKDKEESKRLIGAQSKKSLIDLLND